MTGSSYLAIVVPIIAFIAMAFWLGLVFYADSHPGYGRGKSQEGPESAAPHAASQLSADDLGELWPSADTTTDTAAPSRELEPVGR